ncbi:MAG: hypothetical protein AAF730_17000 [Bacteroidota bacterium]
MRQRPKTQAQQDAFAKHCRFAHHTLLILTIAVLLISVRSIPYNSDLVAVEASRLNESQAAALSTVNEVLNSQKFDSFFAIHKEHCIRLDVIGKLPHDWNSTPKKTLESILYSLDLEPTYISSELDVIVQIDTNFAQILRERPDNCPKTEFVLPGTSSSPKKGPAIIQIPITGITDVPANTIHIAPNEDITVLTRLHPSGTLNVKHRDSTIINLDCENRIKACFNNLGEYMEVTEASTFSDALSLALDIKKGESDRIPISGGQSIPFEIVDHYGIFIVILLQWYLTLHLLFGFNIRHDPNTPWIGYYRDTSARILFSASLSFPCIVIFWLWDGNPPNYGFVFSFFAFLTSFRATL